MDGIFTKKIFKRYNCEAGYCNEEEDVFDNAKIRLSNVADLN